MKKEFVDLYDLGNGRVLYIDRVSESYYTVTVLYHEAYAEYDSLQKAKNAAKVFAETDFLPDEEE